MLAKQIVEQVIDEHPNADGDEIRRRAIYRLKRKERLGIDPMLIILAIRILLLVIPFILKRRKADGN